MNLTVKKNSNGEYIVSKGTGISIGLLVIVLGTIFAIGTYLGAVRSNDIASLDSKIEKKLDKEQYRLDLVDLKERLARIESKVDRLSSHQ